MPQTVKIKRRNASDDNAPGSLSVGELAYNEYQQVLRIGKDNGGAGQHIIAGQGSFVPWPGSPGFVVYQTARSGATPPVATNRSIAVGTGNLDGLAVTNGDGVSGNPTVGLDIQNMTLRAAVDATNDRVAVWDQSLNTNVYYTVNDIAGAASASNSFETWNTDVNGPIVADSATDTGTLAGANGIQTDGTAGSDTITIGLTATVTVPSTDAGAAAGPLLILDRDSATAAASDVIGQLTFRGETAAAGGDHDYAAIHVVIDDATAASEDGRIVFQTSAGGAALADTIQIESDGTLSSTNATYESLITADDDFITKKYFDDNQTGSTQNLFETIAADSGGPAVADIATDTITMTGGEGIVTTAATTPDSITFDLDIPNLTSLGAAPDGADQVVVYDTTGTEHKEITITELFTSPALGGNPTAPTPAQADNDTSIATTAFVRAVRLDQFAAPTASVGFNSQKITGLADGTADTDAVNFGQLTSVASGIDWKASVQLVETSSNLDLTGEETIDGTLTSSSRVLLTAQTAPAENGIYDTGAGAWSRAGDANTSAEVTAGMAVFVTEGTNNADSGWVLTTNDPITLDTTGLTFTQFSGLGQIVAGAGLTKTGNTINAVGTASRISVAADSIDIDSAYVGQATITTLGTIGTGVWQGTAVADEYGGTGQTTYAAGDILYASAIDVLSKLTIGSTDAFLTVTAGVPAWTNTVDGGTF